MEITFFAFLLETFYFSKFSENEFTYEKRKLNRGLTIRGHYWENTCYG